MNRLVVASLFVLASCADSDVGETFQIPGDPEFEYIIDGDMAIPVPNQPLPLNAARGPRTVYLNFEGADIAVGGWNRQNAQTNTSFIPTEDSSVPAFVHQPWGSNRNAVINDILDELREDFEGFDVEFTATRPTEGAYTMIVIGGWPADIGRSGSSIGIAPLDATNYNPSDVAFVFSARMASNGYSESGVAQVIAHELGHSVGLRHINRVGDYMRPSACHCIATWGAGPRSDQPSLSQDDIELLNIAFPSPEPDPNQDPEPDPEPQWIASSCSGGDEGSCDFETGGASGECLAWHDADQNEDRGFCTASCSSDCESAEGFADSACTDLGNGRTCVARAEVGGQCDDVPGTEAVARVDAASGTYTAVCLPRHLGIQCNSVPGVCVDINNNSCGGTIVSGQCPGPWTVRCCTDS